jgi:hypothetical protein
MSKFFGAIALAIAVAGCTTTDEAMIRDMNAWTGRPVRSFADINSLVPIDVHDTPNGERAFIFRKYAPLGSCGITVWGKPQGDEFVVAHMASTCPPGSF